MSGIWVGGQQFSVSDAIEWATEVFGVSFGFFIVIPFVVWVFVHLPDLIAAWRGPDAGPSYANDTSSDKWAATLTTVFQAADEDRRRAFIAGARWQLAVAEGRLTWRTPEDEAERRYGSATKAGAVDPHDGETPA